MERTRQSFIFALKQGDAAAWQELNDRYIPYALARLARWFRDSGHRHRDDVAQEAVTALWVHRDRLKPHPTKPQLRPYVTTVVRNHLVSRLRRIQRENNRIREIQARSIGSSRRNGMEMLSVHEHCDHEEPAQTLAYARNRAQRKYPHEYAAYHLVVVSNWHIRKAANQLNISQATAYRHVNRVGQFIAENL
jgi:RNA polymerase sigma factor (sigma-70 family)